MPFTLVPPELMAAGGLVNFAHTTVSTSTTGTGLIPVDDSIPQNTEGNEYMTLAYTPKATTNKLLVMVTLIGSHTVAGDFITAALFRDSGADALAVGVERNDTAGGKTITFTTAVDAGSVAATTFRVRAGGNSAGTFTFNGNGGGRRFGGRAASSITILEFAA